MARRKRKAKQPSTGPAKSGGDAPAEQPMTEEQQKSVQALGESAQKLVSRLPSLSRVTSVIMLIVGILIVGLLFYKVMVGFFIPLFMAAAMVVIFRPVNEWFLGVTGNRRVVAAAATTGTIMSIVLVPIVLLISVSIGQLSGLVGRADLNEAKAALRSARTQLGMELEFPDQFRRVDELAGLLNNIDEPSLVQEEIAEAKSLIAFLDRSVPGASPTGTSTEDAIDALDSFSSVVDELIAVDGEEETAERVKLEETFHRESVVASAAMHSWMNAKLGGSFRTQLKLFTNPSEKDLAGLIRTGREFIQPRIAKITGETGKVLIGAIIGMCIMLISIYFFLVDGPGMVRTLMRLSPLDDAYELRLLTEFENTSRAVVLASVLSALAQGILAAIAYYLAGLPSVILLFLITTVMAMIPFLGAASVWVPCAIYIGAVEQRWGVAILFVIYSAAIVSTIDNVIKAYVLHGHSELHPLIALLSVLGGVSVFGPIGILIGPMVVVFLQTLLEILNHELKLRDEDDEEAKPDGDADEPDSTEKPDAGANPATPAIEP